MEEIRFFNYGYLSHENQERIVLKESDEADRYCIQLYHHLLTQVDIEGKKLLEIGSGRGGGAYFAKQYMKAKSVTGVDRCLPTIHICNRIYQIPGLNFKHGAAEDLPYHGPTFDVIFNVESSHCYENITAFLKKVKSILRPGGKFLLADLRSPKDLNTLDAAIDMVRFKRLSDLDITNEVLLALEEDSDRRLQIIKEKSPRLLRKLFCELLAIRGTRVFNALKNKDFIYKSYILTL